MEIPYMDPPNKPMTTMYSPPKGPILYKDAIFMDISPSGSLLVGTTNATASFWEGSLQVFNDYTNYEETNWLSYYNSSIMHCGVFLKDTKGDLLISESEFYLKILSLPEGYYEPAPVWKDCAEHFDAVRGIALWKNDSRHALTHSDKHLTVWDLNKSLLKNICNYTDYHTDYITSVDTDLKDNRIFFSTSLDGRICMWDTRTESPASELYMSEFCGLTSVSVNPSNDKLVAFGSESGSIYLLDVSKPKEFLSVHHCYNLPIHKLKFNNSDGLAVCGNTNVVHVYNTSETNFKLIYKDDRKHCNWVRDLVWENDSTLYTCGLQSNVIKHLLS